MKIFWRTKNAFWHIRIAFRRAFRLVAEEIYGSLTNYAFFHRLKLGVLLKRLSGIVGIKSTRQLVARDLESPVHRQPGLRPVVFVSACESEKKPGGNRFCGGSKELEYLVKLLRLHAYEAYLVTWDGSYEPWLVEHQPHISMIEFKQRVRLASDVRCVTSLAVSKAFIRECPGIYFWDMELAGTDHSHFATLADLYKGKIRKVAAISRTVQAWHMTMFGTPCTLIPNLLDESIWLPGGVRTPRRIGYMNEGTHTDDYISRIGEITEKHGLYFEFRLISGVEVNVLKEMRSCEVFLGMNAGKDILWGEGCPRTLIEALSTGCVVLAFDLIGNRETVIDNFNGLLVPRQRIDQMAEALVRLYRQTGELERMRTNALSLVGACHPLRSRWAAIQEFLELDRHI